MLIAFFWIGRFFGRDDLPGFLDVGVEFFVGDAREFNADPAIDADVGGTVLALGVGMDQGGLDAWGGGETDGIMAIVVMVVREHDEDAIAGKEGRFAVGKLFGRIGKAEADAADAILMGVRFGFRHGD